MCILWLCDGVCIVYQNVNTTRRKMKEKYPADALFVLIFVFVFSLLRWLLAMFCFCVLFALMISGYVVLVSSVGVWLKWNHKVNIQAKKYKTRKMSKRRKKKRDKFLQNWLLLKVITLLNIFLLEVNFDKFTVRFYFLLIFSILVKFLKN